MGQLAREFRVGADYRGSQQDAMGACSPFVFLSARLLIKPLRAFCAMAAGR